MPRVMSPVTSPRWLRSWPDRVPADRAYVADQLPRLVISDYDYAPLANLNEDVVVIEWDMAISREDMQRFTVAARRQPDRVLVAPYTLYQPQPPHLAHRQALPQGSRWLRYLEPTCDYFGFGLVYLPHELVRAFLAAPAPERGREPWVPLGDYGDTRLHDQTFSVWHHYRSGQPPVTIAWDVRPVHLHY